MIELKSLTEADAHGIYSWPHYPDAFQLLDYALRPGGWLDSFPESPTCLRFGAWKDGELIGFSMLVHIADNQAEFYVAIHPSHLKHGYGFHVTSLTLDAGFRNLKLHRIYLKVRVWHHGAISLYEEIGFRSCGSESSLIQGQSVNFLKMEIFAENWCK